MAGRQPENPAPSLLAGINTSRSFSDSSLVLRIAYNFLVFGKTTPQMCFSVHGREQHHVDEHCRFGNVHTQLSDEQRTRFGDSERFCRVEHCDIHYALFRAFRRRPWLLPRHARRRSLRRLSHRCLFPPRASTKSRRRRRRGGGQVFRVVQRRRRPGRAFPLGVWLHPQPWCFGVASVRRRFAGYAGFAGGDSGVRVFQGTVGSGE